MKKLFIVVCLFSLLMPSFALSKKGETNYQRLTPAEYFSRYLDVFQRFEWGESYSKKIQDAIEADDLITTLAEIKNQNTKYLQALSLIPLVKDSEFQETVSMAFNVGLVGITQANKALVEILGAASNFNKQSFDNKMASIISAKQNAYEMIFNSAGFLLPIVIEGAKSENPSGLIPYKISSEDRDALKKKFNECFLEQYTSAAKQMRRVKKYSKEKIDFTDLSLIRIYETIFFDTYEESKKKSLIK